MLKARLLDASPFRLPLLLLAFTLLTTSTAKADGAFLNGQTAQIGRGGEGVPCVESREKLSALIDAIAKHDKYGFVEAASGGIALKRGTRVRAIDHAGFLYSEIRIRIESGAEAGIACWMPSDIKGAFINIRQ